MPAHNDNLCLWCGPARTCGVCGGPADPTVVELFPVQHDSDLAAMRHRAAEVLDGFAAELRAGELNGFVAVLAHSTGGTSSVCSEDVAMMPIEYLGGLARVSHRINREQDWMEESDED